MAVADRIVETNVAGSGASPGDDNMAQTIKNCL